MPAKTARAARVPLFLPAATRFAPQVLQVETVVAHTDAEIDAALKALPDVRLIVATAADGQLRAVMRRLVRMYAPAPSKRSLAEEAIPDDRTLPDLPPIGVLPLGPDSTDLVTRLGLPRTPADVAAAVLGGNVRRLDLLRNDAGSVTLDGVAGRRGRRERLGQHVPGPRRGRRRRPRRRHRARAHVAWSPTPSRYATVDGLPLVLAPDMTRRRPRRGGRGAAGRPGRSCAAPRVEIEVRRAHGRAVAITPRADVPFVDDGAEGTLTRKRSWWMERAAWAVYVP